MSEERTPELLPCPFCGNTSLELTNIHDLEDCGNFDTDDCPCEKYENPGACGYYTVVCNFNKGGCGAISGYYSTKERAIAAWNRRTYE